MAKKKSEKDGIRVEKNIYSRYKGESFVVKITHKGHTLPPHTFDTLEQARLFRDGIRARQATDPISTQIYESIVNKQVASSMTLLKSLNKYEQEYSSKKKGYKDSEKNRMNRLREVAEQLNLSHKALMMVDKEDVEAILAVIRAGKPRKEGGKVYPTSNDNLLKYIGILRHMFNVAKGRKEGWGIPLDNPIQRYDFDFPTPNPGRNRRLEDCEWDAIEEQLKKQEALDVYAFILLMVESSIRNGESLKNTWKHVDYGKRKIHLSADITKGKVNRSQARDVALTDRSIEALKMLPQGEPNDHIFPATLTKGRIRYQWEKACKNAGIGDLRVYDLRHEAVSSMVESGEAEFYEVMKMAGHTHPRMTMLYMTLDTADLGQRLSKKRRKRSSEPESDYTKSGRINANSE